MTDGSTHRGPIDVAVIGRRRLYRDALCQVLGARTGLRVIRSAEFVEDVTSHLVDVVLVALTDGSGIAVTTGQALANWRSTLPSPVAATVADWEIGEEDLELLVWLTARGKLPTPTPTATPNALDSLTSREMQILGLLVSGCERGEVSGELGISSHTVRTHLNRINVKLGVHSRLEAVALARSLGVLGLRLENRR